MSNRLVLQRNDPAINDAATVCDEQTINSDTYIIIDSEKPRAAEDAIKTLASTAFLFDTSSTNHNLFYEPFI